MGRGRGPVEPVMFTFFSEPTGQHCRTDRPSRFFSLNRSCYQKNIAMDFDGKKPKWMGSNDLGLGLNTLPYTHSTMQTTSFGVKTRRNIDEFTDIDPRGKSISEEIAQLHPLHADSPYALVFFYADWCGACNAFKSRTDFATAVAEDSSIRQNIPSMWGIEESKARSQLSNIGVEAFPTFILYKVEPDGRRATKVASHTGAGGLANFVAKHFADARGRHAENARMARDLSNNLRRKRAGANLEHAPAQDSGLVALEESMPIDKCRCACAKKRAQPLVSAPKSSEAGLSFGAMRRASSKYKRRIGGYPAFMSGRR